MIAKKIIQKRRDFLKLSLVTATYLLAGCGGGGSSNNTTNDETNKDGLIINASLNIPPLIDPKVDSSGVKQYNLSIQKATHNFYKDKVTNTFGINQSYLVSSFTTLYHFKSYIFKHIW